MRWLCRSVTVALLALAGNGCGGAAATLAPAGSDSFETGAPSMERRVAQPKHRDRLPADVVERAACEFSGVRADGQALSAEELYGELEQASVLCLGEDPASAQHQWVALSVLEELSKRAPSLGLELGLGLEMFSARDQRKLDAYAAKELGEAELLTSTQYEDSWGYDFALYRPIIEYASSRGIRLVALNADPEILKRVTNGGLEALGPDEVDSLPELEFDGEGHRRSLGGGAAATTKAVATANAYTAEVVREETAADQAARWVGERRPARQLLILARAKDCERMGIPARLVRRGTGNVLSVCPVLENQTPSAQIVPEGCDYALVVSARGADSPAN